MSRARLAARQAKTSGGGGGGDGGRGDGGGGGGEPKTHKICFSKGSFSILETK